MYDVIGDVHGHASRLEALLKKLGYWKRAGVWRHPDRTVVFLGDFVDRGPEQAEAVRIARSMVKDGEALAIMGNHEFNAVSFATPDPDHPGEFLRPHSEKNRQQHRAFLNQVGEGTAQHAEIIDWFRRLPLYLDLDGLRAIHACWHPAHLEQLGPYLTQEGQLQSEAWSEANRKGSPVYEAIETLLKGLELPLPTGRSFLDKDGNERTNIRVRWWDGEATTYRDLALLPEESRRTLPAESVPEGLLPGYDNEKPIFFGHYWFTGRPSRLTPHVACLDYSVVCPPPAGKLVAYRWDGEAEIMDRNFVQV